RKKEGGSVGADVPVFRMHFSIVKAVVHHGGIAGAAHNGVDGDERIEELAIDVASVHFLAMAGDAFHEEERRVVGWLLRRSQKFSVNAEDRIGPAQWVSFVLAYPLIVLGHRRRGKAHYNKNCCKGIGHGQT